MRVKFEAAVRRAQDDICKAVSDMDGKQFHEDSWIRPGGGGGVSRVLQVQRQLLICLSQKFHYNLDPIIAFQLRMIVAIVADETHQHSLAASLTIACKGMSRCITVPQYQ